MYAQGYNAYCYGSPYTSNPCAEHTSAYWAWSEGWLDAEQAAYDVGMGHWWNQ